MGELNLEMTGDTETTGEMERVPDFPSTHCGLYCGPTVLWFPCISTSYHSYNPTQNNHIQTIAKSIVRCKSGDINASLVSFIGWTLVQNINSRAPTINRLTIGIMGLYNISTTFILHRNFSKLFTIKSNKTK